MAMRIPEKPSPNIFTVTPMPVNLIASLGHEGLVAELFEQIIRMISRKASCSFLSPQVGLSAFEEAQN